MSISLILVIIAIVLFVLAAIGVPSGRVNLIASGLALWCLSTVIRS